MAKHIFVIGGVLSSLGKGIASASIGFLLQKMGYKVAMQKLDPYLNVDPGTMSPFQHGEVFVTDDGSETDLDLGHYERFTGLSTNRNSNTTSGVIYENVIKKERKGEYLGKTVQVIPHVTNEIKHFISKLAEGNDIVITEIGGTVGDIESLPFLEAVRQFRLDVGYENSMFIFLSYVPYIHTAGEVKTKPTQHSAYKLREIGIQPDLILCRCEQELDDEIKQKIALFTNVNEHDVFSAIDVNCVYEIPKIYYQYGVQSRICKHLRIEEKEVDFIKWDKFLTNNKNPQDGTVNIALCGKYVDHKDAYKSVVEALSHSAAWNNVKLNIKWVDSEANYNEQDYKELLGNIDGILVPGGFGIRGISGKINIVKYARTNNIPFLGICLGMQVAVIEFAQNVCNIEDAYSSEFDENTKNPIIDLMSNQKYINGLGGSMRLGAYPCVLKQDSLAAKIYQKENISERHRHRYEFNNKYRSIIEEFGMNISGLSPDDLLVEAVEIKGHPFFIGVQFHPEFKSNPETPHPLFKHFIKAAKK
ncbi:MAG TPA: CTP synthase [Candidatus Cloacimonadota bacterium]|jgi:CTP synthase|nr:CTP synthase [Candidatus Cloacimonadales bacterium]HPY96292.1 CTP synthase [Candidatus Cloacimonadota bacterium]HQB40216.1 CTP synthase [Candidatus Cloacimonadota bacterium]